MTAIIDYGVGNLFSLKSSLRAIGCEAVVTADREVISKSERLILPGVGAFSDAAAKLRQSSLDKLILQETARGKPLLGICLGMQLLFEKSFEYGEHEGLGLIKGRVVPIKSVAPDVKIPQIGWNSLIFPKDKEKSPIYTNVNEGDCVYFVHSYFATDCLESTTALTEYSAMLTASVQNGCVYGTQFHPEKSGKVGLAILKSFCNL